MLLVESFLKCYWEKKIDLIFLFTLIWLPNSNFPQLTCGSRPSPWERLVETVEAELGSGVIWLTVVSLLSNPGSSSSRFDYILATLSYPPRSPTCCIRIGSRGNEISQWHDAMLKNKGVALACACPVPATRCLYGVTSFWVIWESTSPRSPSLSPAPREEKPSV